MRATAGGPAGGFSRTPPASAEGAFDQRLAELERSGRVFGLHALTVTRGEAADASAMP